MTFKQIAKVRKELQQHGSTEETQRREVLELATGLHDDQSKIDRGYMDKGICTSTRD
jgi:hypothetical protein